MTCWAILRYTLTGHDQRVTFPTTQARALCIVALGKCVTVLQEGETDA